MKTIYVNLFVLAFLTAISNFCNAQSYGSADSNSNPSEFKWPEGKRMGISLTFDDARKSQIDRGVPLLDKYNVKGTFYVSVDSLTDRVHQWKSAAENGHDIGNHTLRHACSGNFVWSRHLALEDYTLDQMEDEIKKANSIISELLGVLPVSFAYPCGQTFVGRGENTKSYVPLVARNFESGRNWMAEAPNDPVFCDFSQLTGMKLDGNSFDAIRNLIESKKCSGKWLVLVSHETLEKADSINLVTTLSTLEAICEYAKNPANGIWIDNVHNIATYIAQTRENSQAGK
jgi:peptidoglycan-N-acetylglucosamine deacetylase